MCCWKCSEQQQQQFACIQTRNKQSMMSQLVSRHQVTKTVYERPHSDIPCATVTIMTASTYRLASLPCNYKSAPNTSENSQGDKSVPSDTLHLWLLVRCLLHCDTSHKQTPPNRSTFGLSPYEVVLTIIVNNVVFLIKAASFCIKNGGHRHMINLVPNHWIEVTI